MYSSFFSLFSYITINNINFNLINTMLCKLNSFKINIFIIIIVNFAFFQNKIIYFLNFIILLLVFTLKVKFNYILINFYYGYYKIHPILLYVSLILILFLLLKVKFFFKYNLTLLILISTTTLLLGSLWAITQSVWGRYWSNDSIEIILVFFILIIFSYIHKIFLNSSKINNFVLIQLLFLLALLRLNFIYTKHNFFQNKTNFNFIYFIVIYFIFSFFLTNFNNNLKLFSNYKTVSLFLYVIISNIFFNAININIIKLFFYWLTLTTLLFLLLKLIIIKKYIFLHLLITISILILVNFYLNFLKISEIYFFKKNFLNVEFFLKKKINNYFFFKNNFLNKDIYFFKNNFFLNKSNNFYLYVTTNNSKLINIF